MDIRKLRYFLILSEELHFRRAAEKLNITQAPLSLSIQAIERELGAQLFHRTNRRVSLTKVGAAFQGHAASIIEQLDRAVEDIHQMAAGEAGRLLIGYTPASSLSFFFSKAIRTFRTRYSGVKIDLHQLSSKEQMAALANRKIDVGFFRTAHPLRHSDIRFTYLVKDALVVAMHAGHPLGAAKTVDIHALKDEPLIFSPPEAGVGIRDQVMHMFSRHGLIPNIVQEAYDAPTAISLSAAGLGVTIVPPDLQYIKVPNIIFRPLEGADAITHLLLGNRMGEENALVANFRHITQSTIASAKRG
ncbi:DNA-binding transcriptional LysR family regulator [Sphingopyxis panaciterrae]|uniref:LysR substrate-binding domain-containing protein n=1 Tax=Sphingopyxis panaciterrae TaxID=363841 RepID=UPI00141DDAA3|nr:LysR substrate-binding domain-containing protein [Sphingopyxis panaciterrae]NIJ37432.1 DNA-binding transcriptional LysR family regulator [Sphingopyxis panaciterrae]